MALLNSIYCQICDTFITKERWNKRLYSSRLLHREVHEHWPAYFPQTKLTKVEGMILENSFREMVFGSVNVLPVYGFLKLCIMMFTIREDYVTLDPEWWWYWLYIWL